MKKASIASLVLLSAFANVPSVSADQEIVSQGTNDVNVHFSIDPTYTISIPADIRTSSPGAFEPGERELMNFEIKASDVVIPNETYIEVMVHTKAEFKNKGKNALLNQDGQYLDFNFKRLEGANYGFSATDQDGSGIWKIAEFYPITNEKHTDTAPVSVVTSNPLVYSGDYQSTLVFDITLNGNDTVIEHIETPNTKVTEQTDDSLYIGEYEIVQEAKPKIEEVTYDVIYKNGAESSRSEVSRKTIQEGQEEIRKVGTIQPTALQHFTWKATGEGTVAITGYSDSAPTDVIVPREIEGKLVTKVDDNAFRMNDYYFDDNWDMHEETDYRNNSLTSVKLPNTITHIGRYAFKGAEEGYASQLRSVTLPNSVTHIGEGAFQTLMLNDITWSNSLEYIGREAFTTNMLSNLILPDSVTEIGASAFARANVQSLTLPKNLTKLGTGAFAENQFTTVVIPGKLKVIPTEAFAMGALQNVTIPDTVEKLEAFAFAFTQISAVTVSKNTVVEADAFDEHVTINRR